MCDNLCRIPPLLFVMDSLHSQEEELCDKCKTLYYAEQLEFVDNSLSPSQLQQYYHLPSASVNSDEDFQSEVPHYHLMHGGDSTGNGHVPAPAHLHDTRFSQSNGRFPSDLTAPFLENGQHEIHVAAGQPPHTAFFNHARSPFSDDPFANNLGFTGNASESYPNEDHPHSVYDNQSESPHASDRLLVCKWHDSRGPCGKHVNEEEVADHMSSSHLPQPGRTPMKCRWDGCKLKRDICRDTIIRHVRQIHFKIRPRRQ